MDEFPRHWSFDQSFGYEPAVGPEIVRKGREVLGIALDSEEVDGCRSPFWDVAEPSGEYNVSVGRTKRV